MRTPTALALSSYLLILSGRLGDDGFKPVHSFLVTPPFVAVRECVRQQRRRPQEECAFRNQHVNSVFRPSSSKQPATPPRGVLLWARAAKKATSATSNDSSSSNSDGVSTSKKVSATKPNNEDKQQKENDDDEFVQAQDLGALQSLFSKHCDKQGLMTKAAVMKVPAIAELMEEDDLLPEEFDDIWDRAPKFPDTDVVEQEDNERIDVDSFVQVYRDIDDLFENDDEDDNDNNADTNKNAAETTNVKSTDGAKAVSSSLNDKDEDEKDDENDDASMEGELEVIFESLSDKAGLVSKSALKEWDEIRKLIDDGLLGDDEFEDLWQKTKKASSGSGKEMLDVEGFLSFNVALDDLFDFEDDDEMEDADDEPKLAYTDEKDDKGEETRNASIDATSVRLVVGSGLSPDTLFVALANPDGLVGLDELQRWSELQEMLVDGDLLESELLDIFKSVKKSEMDLNKVEEEGFIALYNAIDDLFEEDDDEDNDGNSSASAPVAAVSKKEELLDAISDLEDPDLLPCGLEALELEQKEMLSLIEAVEKESTNEIRLKQGAIEPKDLEGTWDLLYSSSSAMKFNKGLSGLGGSFPNGRFSGLKQKLKSTKVMSDVEYIERIEVNPSTASFDVTVNGSWDLSTSVSLFTGEPSIVMTVEPDRVTYGPTSTRADHWKSLGPMNMLDITYLDDELRIMRGNTSVETVFVFRRSS